MSAIVPQYYEGTPLAVKYAWVDGQPGLKAVEAAAESVRTMGRRLNAITDAAGSTMRDLGVSWTGPASDAAQRSSKQIVDKASRTATLADNGADRILDYGHSFDEMRKRIAFEDPSKLSWTEQAAEAAKVTWDMRPWADAEDHVSILARNQRHDTAANDALRWHEANARQADDGFVTAGSDPQPPPGGAAGGSGSAGGTGGGGVPVSSAPGPVAAASAAPPAVGTPAPAPAASAPPVAGPAPAGPGMAPLPAGPGGAGPNGSGAAGGARKAAPAAAGVNGGTVGGGGAGRAGAGGTGATGPAGIANPAQERARLGEQFGRDIAAGNPSARSAPGAGTTGTGPGGGWFGSGGRPATGDPGGAGRLGSGWGPGGRSPLAGEAGSRTGGGVGGWRGGSGEPTPRLPGETGTRTWSRTPGMAGEGPPARPVAGEPAVAGRSGAGSGPGYAPMMGGAGGMRSNGEGHHNRYLLPSSEAFDVDVPCSPPVLAPEEDG